jgi:hypothetical protein
VGFDSATHYHTFVIGPPGKTSEYADGMEKSINLWKATAPKVNLPYFPDCPVGWNNSPRYAKNAHIFVHRSPDQFEMQLLAANYFVAAQPTKPPVIFISAWNECTEDHCLLPDGIYGYAYLEAVRRQFHG